MAAGASVTKRLQRLMQGDKAVTDAWLVDIISKLRDIAVRALNCELVARAAAQRRRLVHLLRSQRLYAPALRDERRVSAQKLRTTRRRSSETCNPRVNRNLAVDRGYFSGIGTNRPSHEYPLPCPSAP